MFSITIDEARRIAAIVWPEYPSRVFSATQSTDWMVELTISYNTHYAFHRIDNVGRVVCHPDCIDRWNQVREVIWPRST